MSFLQAKAPISATPQQLNSINVDRSRYGDPVPLVYGMQRIPVTLLWYGAFQSVAQSTKSGGKGGGGKQVTSYQYYASCVMGLCEGPIFSIKQLWKDKSITTYAAENLVLFTGGTPVLFTVAPTGATSGTLTAAPAVGNGVYGMLFSDNEFRLVTITAGTSVAWVGALTGSPQVNAILEAQPIWSYLSTNFPAQAVPYDHTAYFGAQNLSLGSSAAIPNYTAEVQAFLSLPGINIFFTSGLAAGATSGTLTASITNGVYDITFSDYETRSCTIAGGVNVTWDTAFGLVNAVSAGAILGGYDADPSAVWLDYCTDVNHGCNFLGTNAAVLQGAGNTYQTYCTANSLRISPWEDTQRTAASFLTDILELTNSNCVMSVGQLNVYPYCDVAVTGNGVTYTPTLTPLFAFTDDDYRLASAGSGGGASNSDDPVQMTRKPLTETYNVILVEFYDRANNYNAALAEWKDDNDIAINGIRKMATKTFHQITTLSVALQVAALIGQRQLYIRNTYQFSVRADLYSLLEPMDLISITDSGLNIANKLCRVIQIDDDENDVFTITAEEMFVGTASAPRYSVQAAQGYFANFAVAPPSVFTPVIFSAPPALVGAGGGYELWSAVCGTVPTASYGGCNVYASLDDATWTYAGTITGESRIGTVTTAHAIGPTDTTIFLTLYPDTVQLDSSSASDFAANRALIWLDGEIIGFNVVTLLSGQNYSVTVSRGLFGTAAASHAVGASFAQLDATIFRMPFDPGMIGQTIHFKFYSFNTVGQATQTSASDYPYLITDFGQGQLISGPLTLVTSGVTVNGTSAYKSSSVSGWNANFYSSQSYVNGAFCSFKPAQTNGDFFVGLATAPTAGNSFTVLNYGIECYSTGNYYYYESGVGALVGAYAVGDTFSITYDGAFIRYLHNGAQFRQIPVPPNLQLYLDSSFNLPQSAVYNIQFGPYGTATPVLWIPRGNCQVSDENVTKQGGSSAWDSDVYSINGYQTCHLVFKTNQFIVGGTGTVGIVAGFVSGAPPQSPGLAAITYGMNVNDTGGLEAYESGTQVNLAAAYVVTDFLAMTYDGANVKYIKNSTVLRTVAIAGLTMFADVLIYDPGSAINSLEFGPGAVIPLLDTAQVSVNAATISLIANNSSGSGGTISGVSGLINSGFLIHPVGPAFDCTAIITATIGASQPAGALGDVKVLVRFADDGSTYVSATQEVPLNSTSLQPYALQWEFTHSKVNVGSAVAAIWFDVGNVADGFAWNTASIQIEYIIR